MICFRSSALTLDNLKNRTPAIISHRLFPHLRKPFGTVINKFFHRQVNEKVAAILRAEDKIPESYEIIYRAPLKTYFKVTYYAAFSSLAMLSSVIGTSLYMAGPGNYPFILYNAEIIHSTGELYGLMGALLLVTMQVSLIVFQYPLRIYKNSEKKHYIAVYQHLLPWKHKNEEFLAGELRKSAKSIMPWRDSLYVFRKRKAILIEDHFSKPAELNEMLQPRSPS